MRITSISGYENRKSPSFGYNLPYNYQKYHQTRWTSDLINHTGSDIYYKEISGESDCTYKQYLIALDNFGKKRFDATELDKLYRPQIEACDSKAKEEYDEFVNGFLTNADSNNATNSSKADLSKLNASVSKVYFERFGSFFDGSNPNRDFYSRDIVIGKHNINLIRVEDDSTLKDAKEDANEFLEKSLANAGSVYNLMNTIDKKIADYYSKKCESILAAADARKQENRDNASKEINQRYFPEIAEQLAVIEKNLGLLVK